ncbi:MAG: phenylalanine--tRNA ligase beta subunit-related protein [Candidatus Aminicenantes bacterium]|jgi:lysyl-tRNA synthetase class 2
MIFAVDAEIFGKFPDLYLGIVIAGDLDNRGDAVGLRPLISTQQETIRANASIETLSELPKIAAWRRAYSSFGAKPKKHKSSVESLYRMILKGIDLRHINPIVDVYNYISIKHMVPVGGDDISRVEGDITLRLASGGEMFRPLNSEAIEYAKGGEVIYADDVEVLCRRWNWRECDKTKMTEETKEAILVVEGLPPVDREGVERIVGELSRLVKKFCSGTTHLEILHADKPEIVLSP